MYESIISDILNLEEEKPEDYWRDIHSVPLFTKKVFYEYENGIVPEEDVIDLKIDTRSAQARNPFNALVCASTGVGKTRLIKNIIKGFWKAGYKILIFEPKSVEMMNMRRMGKGVKIHQLDKNEKLPAVSYCPNHIKKYLEMNFPTMLKKVKFYSPNLKFLDYREIWQSFGVPDKAADMIVNFIADGHYDWNIICVDTVGNNNTLVDNRSLGVDSNNPQTIAE